jgi:hypothetical protein
MEELAGLLNRERLLLELLLFKLVALRQLLIAGEVRFLPWASEEVDRATEKVREAELRRSVAVEGVVVAAAGNQPGHVLGSTSPSAVTLRTLAESAAEPWRTIFTEHRRALLELASDLEDAVSATRRLAATAGAAVSATLDRLTGSVPSGDTALPGSPARPATAATYGPSAKWEPATAEARFTRTL